MHRPALCVIVRLLRLSASRGWSCDREVAKTTPIKWVIGGRIVVSWAALQGIVFCICCC